MFDRITNRKKYQFALAELERLTRSSLSETPFEEELQKYFFGFTKDSSFSQEACVALVLMIYALRLCEAAYQLREQNTYSLEISTRFMGIHAITTAATMWEMKAADTAEYGRRLGIAIKSEFNSIWQRLQDQADAPAGG